MRLHEEVQVIRLNLLKIQGIVDDIYPKVLMLEKKLELKQGDDEE